MATQKTVNFHAHEVTRPLSRRSPSRLRAGLRSARLLLERHVTRRSAVRAPLSQEIVLPPAVTMRPEVTPTVRTATPQELVQARSTTTLLKNNQISVNHMPLLNRDEVANWTGLDVGALQAVVHGPNNQEPLLCFDRSTKNEHGVSTNINWLIMTPTQLKKLHSIEMSGGNPHERSQWLQGVARLRGGGRRVVGANNPLPGTAIQRHAPITDANDHIKPEFKGNVELLASDALGVVGNLSITDLDSAGGTLVQYNAEPMPAHDLWAGNPIGYEPLFDPAQLPPYSPN